MMNDDPNSPEFIAYNLHTFDQFDYSIIPATSRREWMSCFDDHPYRCLPLVMANQMGWFLLNPVAFTAEWLEDDPNGWIKITYDEPIDPEKSYLGRYFGNGILTWHIPFLFRTPPGYNLLVRGPANWLKHGIQPLEGMVETDWNDGTFTMNWKFTGAGCPVRFEKDEPFCMITPVRRGELEGLEPRLIDIQDAPETYDAYIAWSQKRHALKNETLARKKLAIVQKQVFKQRYGLDYFRGKTASAARPFSNHQTHLSLKHFSSVWKSKLRSLLHLGEPKPEAASETQQANE